MNSTRLAFIGSKLLGVPFFALVSMLSIILYKDMHISPWLITIILALKPASALIAPYCSHAIYHRPDLLKSNLLWSHFLRYLPFLFIPWIESAWAIVACFGFYMVLLRGATPAWMEAFKRQIPDSERERLVAYGSTIDYCGAALLPIILGILLDEYETAWKWLFFATAALGLISSAFLLKIPKLSQTEADVKALNQERANISQHEQVTLPWRRFWHLLKKDARFAQFQAGFMLGGFGLMVMQPALPIFFMDVLQLSYTKLMVAMTMCKGIGFALTSPLWVKRLRSMDIFSFCALVTVLAGIFPLLLASSQLNIAMLYTAYCFYGAMQAGSELSWHMSGPIFAKESDSSVYTGINVITVGLRGCTAPFLGALLFSQTNSTTVMVTGALFCFLATWVFQRAAVPVFPKETEV